MSEWIPVSERLPGKSDVYLVAYSNGGQWTETFVPRLGWVTDTPQSPALTITHWMPLPEPPK